VASLILLTTTAASLHADTPPEYRANYQLAATWTGQKVGKLVFDTAVSPHWLEQSERFWYSYETPAGRKFYLVDPRAKSKKLLFDSAHVAAMLTRITLFPYDAQHLPITKLRFVNKDTAIQFDIDYPKDAAVRDGDVVKTVGELGETTKTDKTDNKNVKDDMTDKSKKGTDTGKDTESKTKTLTFQYDLATEKLTLLPDYKAIPKKPDWASVSPDEKTIVFARGFNLYTMDATNYALAQKKADDKNIKETQITTDGEDHYSYSEVLKDDRKKDFQKLEKDRKDYRVPPIGISWSKNSKKFAVIRNDDRKVADLWVINSLSEPRPTLETYRYDMPGEVNVSQDEMLVFDVASKAKVKVKTDRFKDQNLGIESDRVLSTERENDKVVDKWLSDTSDKLYFTRVSRDRHRLDVCVANTATGDVTTLIEERLNTYIDGRPLKLINNGEEIVFWSERDGWGHYYLYDGKGTLKNQITSGEFTCEQVEGLDAKGRVLYFTACGREAGEDPYYTHLYRVRLDGSGIKLLDPGDSLHAPAMNDAAQVFVDNSSRVDAAPASQLRDSSGNLLIDLETTDASALLAAGYKFPEPFKVKADDGITDIYGVMYKPFDFNPNRKYPLIEYVYPGPQTEAVSKTFSPRSGNMALAQLGFIVIEIGNRGGNPQRSKWYHNFGYGNLRDYGLADKKRAAEELALKYPWIDLDRVGIYGHSGGGFMSTAAMLVYPDFFKVAFSESGNHENNVYNRWWSETHHGVKEVTDKDGNVTFQYNIERNSDIAKNLKGHLMLTTGDIDDNVHPGNTYRLANALIRANKRFDLFIFPGQRHGYGDMSDYCFWLRADYFARWLLGDAETSVDILELDRERPQVGNKAPR
jgi:dipeptidyl aminopeptidase/acylaminoacyl peptidase